QIHQPKSDQLEQELCAYLAKYTQVIYPTVSAIHLLEVEALMQRLSVDFDWTFLKPNKKLAEFKTLMRKADPQADLAQRQYAIKEFLLQQIAQAAPTENPALLKEQLRARELRSATTMKSGVALPHTISSAVEKPALVAIALDENIDWGGVFGPVSHIIAMLLPANPQPFHTSAFRALSLSFLNHKTGEFICEHKTSEELHAILHCLMKVPKNPINHQPLSIKLS
ncbi:MAG: PTS sugar transporter subunit IIA, partial [Vibrio sp.]